MQRREPPLAIGVLLFLLLAPFLSGEGAAQERPARDSAYAEVAADLADLQSRLDRSWRGVQRARPMRDGQPDSVVAVDPEMTIHAEPDRESQVLETLDEGTRLRVFSVSGNWYEVLLRSPVGDQSVGWLPAQTALPVGPQLYRLGVGLPFVDMWDEVVQKAAEIREKYTENPYVRVTGFDVEVGFPPSVTVGFEFKQEGGDRAEGGN